MQSSSNLGIHRATVIKMHNKTNQYIQSEIRKQMEDIKFDVVDDKNPGETNIMDNLGKSLRKLNDKYRNVKSKVSTFNEGFKQGGF